MLVIKKAVEAVKNARKEKGERWKKREGSGQQS
jgi:hypothetical protein